MSAERITKLLKKGKRSDALAQFISLIRTDYENPGHLDLFEHLVRSMIVSNTTKSKTALFCSFVDELVKQKRLKEAVPLASYIYRYMNEQPEPNRLMAIVCEKLDDNKKTQTYLERLCQVEPSNANNFAYLGRIKRANRDMKGALECFNHALGLDDKSEALLSELGIFLFEVGEYSQCADIYKKLFELHPRNELAAANLMISLMAMGKLDAAADVISKADDILQKNAFYLDAKAKIRLEQGQLDAALECSERAIALKPDKDTFKATLSHVLLSSGRLKEGFEHYKHRFSSEMIGGVLLEGIDIPLLKNRNQAKNKHIFVRSEQGFGDTLNFCQLLSLIQNDAKKVTFSVQQPLLNLMRETFPALEIVDGKRHPEDADYYCPLIDLAAIYRIDLADLPLMANYVAASDNYAKKWNERLGPKKTLRVGLTWSGGTATRHDNKRTITLSDFLDCLPEGPEYISLQKEVRKYDVDTLKANPKIRHFGDELQDFRDTAALMSGVDLVVSVDTSIVHLAGAMGKTTWVLIPFKADFRWLTQREDSPWYPTLKLFRQANPSDWAPVIDTVKAELNQYFVGHGLRDAG